MNGLVALPLLAVLVVAFAGRGRLRRLHPAAAARSSAVLLVAISVAAVPTLWLLGFGGLARIGVRLQLVDWCAHLLPGDRLVGAVVGLTTLIAAVVGAGRAVRVLRVHASMRCTERCPVRLVDTDAVFAYTLPGPAGTIAISTGLRRSLTDDEYGVVLAHEMAHARHRHDRYLLVARVARAVFPLVAPLARDLEFHIERWADEDAIERTGAARSLAARTIAKVAVALSVPAPALGIAGTGTIDRATALLAPANAPSVATRLQVRSILAITVVAAAVQTHHTAAVTLGLLA